MSESSNSQSPNSKPISPLDARIHKGLWLALAVLAIALSWPPIDDGRTPRRRLQCKNNLTSIAVALHGYHETHGAFPPAYTVDSNGKPLHSWRTLILPWIDETALYNSINLSEPWNAPDNLKAYENSNVLVYQCPGPRVPKHFTTYLAIVGDDCFFHPTQPRKLSEIPDGTPNTLALFETTPERAVKWMSPSDADQDLVLAIQPDTRQSHAGGSFALVADGHVRFIPDTTPRSTLRALLTIAGNEELGDW